MVQLRKSKARRRASRVFTDREIPQKVFISKLEETISNDNVLAKNSVITFYGIGGVGKTRLKKELTKISDNTSNQFLLAHVDFSFPELNNIGRFLCEVLNQLELKGVKFPHFKIAYSIYFAKKNPDMVFNEDTIPFIEESGLIATLMSAVDGFGVLGATKDLVNQAYNLYNKTLALNNDVKAELEALGNMHLDEIEDSLISFFNYDLDTFCEKASRFPIIFIDTYEAVLTNQETMSTHWLKEFVETSNNTLFVLFGRDKILWDLQDPSGNPLLDQHLLENLSKQDSYSFLDSCGISDNQLKEKMYNLSTGHPFHLDLSVDTYDEIVAQTQSQPSPDQFGQNKSELLAKFQQHLDKDEINLLKVLSIANYFNDQIFDLLVKTFSFSHMVDADQQLLRFSFVNLENEAYFIHKLMRQHLKETLSAKITNKVHTTLLNHYENLLLKINTSSPHDIIQVNLSEAIYHATFIYQGDAFTAWLNRDEVFNAFQILAQRGASKYLLDMFDTIRNHVTTNNLPTLYKSLFIDMYHLRGDYQKAANTLSAMLAGYSKEEILRDSHITHQYIRKIHHQMFYKPVQPLIDELIAFYNEAKPTSSQSLIQEIEFMIGGNLGVMTGDFGFSINWLKKCITGCKRDNNIPLLVRALRKYGDALKGQHKYARANSIYNIAISLSEKHKLERYAIYLNCCKGDLLRLIGEYAKSQSLLEETRQRACNFNIVGWIAHCDLALACLKMTQKKNCSSEMSLALKSYTKINQQWGLQNVYIRAYLFTQTKQQIKGMPIPNDIKKSCNNLGYSYEVSLIEKIGKSEKINFPLLFL